jgi:hypothetical protein
MLYPNICYTIVISHHVISLLVYYNTLQLLYPSIYIYVHLNFGVLLIQLAMPLSKASWQTVAKVVTLRPLPVSLEPGAAFARF